MLGRKAAQCSRKDNRMYILTAHEEGCWTRVLSKDENLDNLVVELVSEVERTVKRAGCDFDPTTDDGDDYQINRPANAPRYFGDAIASASFDSGDTSFDWAIHDLDAPKCPETYYKIYRVTLGAEGDLINAGYISKAYKTDEEARNGARAIAIALAQYHQALFNVSGDDNNRAEFNEGSHSDDSDFAVRIIKKDFSMYEKFYIEKSAISEVK